MSHLFPVVPALRPALTNPRTLRTAWRPAEHEDRGFFSAVTGWRGVSDYEPEGAADWGNKVLSEADFNSPLYL